MKIEDWGNFMWAVGIWEGEGSIYMVNQGGRVQVSITNNDLSVLEKIKEIWKGQYWRDGSKHQHSPSIFIRGQNQVIDWIRLIYPHVKSEYKRKQIEQVIFKKIEYLENSLKNKAKKGLGGERTTIEEWKELIDVLGLKKEQ